jgi:hypothetical protein
MSISVPRPSGIRMSTNTDPERIIQVLNRKQPTEEDCRVARARFDGRLAPIPQEEFKPFFEEYLSKQLRSYVDPWLESGKKPDGSEKPLDREVSALSKLKVHAYLDTHRPEFILSSDPWGFAFVLDPFTDHAVTRETVFEAVQNNAIRMFCALISSEWRVNVCKCRYAPCGRYYLLGKPRRTYRHGTFCSAAHRGHASALALTKARRSHERAGFLELASRWLVAAKVGPTWADDDALKRRLSRYLCNQIGRRSGLRAGCQPVRINWITRHRDEIERRRLLCSVVPRP